MYKSTGFGTLLLTSELLNGWKEKPAVAVVEWQNSSHPLISRENLLQRYMNGQVLRYTQNSVVPETASAIHDGQTA